MKLNDEILKSVVGQNGVGRAKVSEQFGIPQQEARVYVAIAQNLDVLGGLFETDEELIEQSVKNKKQSQKYQDTNRIERKSFREYARIENALTEYTKELTNVFDQNPIQIKTIKHKSINNDAIGIFQLSDLHLNEIVEIEGNTYDFVIASKRLQKYVDKAIEYFKTKNISNVLIAMTSDILNSDRRMEEALANATNRSKATFLAVQLIENVIIHLNQHFNISIASVMGNESRVGKDVAFQHQVASDNYDLVVYNILEYHLRDKKGITFLGGDGLQKVVNIAGYNWLLIHGHQSGFAANSNVAISKLIRLYADKGVLIRFVIYGHLHEAHIADTNARSSSLVGANAYSENGLMLTSRASQNLHIAYGNGEIDSIKIDLQEIDGYEGYPIQKELEAYNAKSASKVYRKEVIFQIVI